MSQRAQGSVGGAESAPLIILPVYMVLALRGWRSPRPGTPLAAHDRRECIVVTDGRIVNLRASRLPQLRAEALSECGDDVVVGRVGLLAGQRPLRRAQDDGERDALLARRNLRAAVHVEELQ